MKYLILTILLILNCSACFAEQPQAVGGLLDLSDWKFEQDGNVALEGEWEFYWQQHLSSFELSLKSDAEKKFISVPGNWNDTTDDRNLPSVGFATYRLNVLVPDSEPLALKLLTVGTAYRLYVDGNELVEVGRAGKSLETTTPNYRSKIVTFVPQSNRVEIVLQVSNFHHRNAGLWEVIRIGRPDGIASLREGELASDLILFGAIFMMGLYNLVTWATRHENQSSLFLGMFCLLIAVRIVLVDERYISDLAPNLGWPLLTRLEYFCWMISVPTFLSMIRSLYRDEVSVLAARALWGLALVIGVLALVLPIKAATELVPPFQIITVTAIVYGAYTIGLAIWRKREGSILLGIGCLFLFSMAVNDILIVLFTLDTANQLQFGLFVFVLLQSIQVSLRHSRAFQLIEFQSNELLKTNLELQIQEKLRRAAEGESIMLHEQVDYSQRLSSFSVIATSMAEELAESDESLVNERTISLLTDIGQLLRHETLDRVSVDPAKFFDSFYKSDEFLTLHKEFERVQVQCHFDKADSKISISSTLIRTLILYLMRYVFETQVDRQSVQIVGRRDYVLAGSLFHHQVNDGHYYILSVEDSGNGIRPEDLVEIFDPEQKASGFSSLALPLRYLAVAWVILEDHGGALDLHSTKDVTRLELYFPCNGEMIFETE